MAADVQAGSKPGVSASFTGTTSAQYQGCSVCSLTALSSDRPTGGVCAYVMM